VLGSQPSVAIELVIGTAQRRHPVVGMCWFDIKAFLDHEGEFVWFCPPAFRKTADRLQSSDPHQIPLVGFAAALVGRLDRQMTATKAYVEKLKADPTDLKPATDWYFPVSRKRRKGIPNLQPHMSESTLNQNIAAMPGVAGILSPQALRRAFASYGSKIGKFTKGQAAMILDHLEGEDDNVTRGHYDLDPRIEEKRALMIWWTSWLDEQCAAAIAADPILSDHEALRQACYIQRYGQATWEKKLAKTRKTGAPLWPTDSIDDAA
jgi:integrase